MIELENVTKKYGSTIAIDHLSLSFPDSGIFCLLGRNGAGKTTLMKLIAGRTYTTDGRVVVNGKEISPSKMPDGVNYIDGSSTQFNMKVSALIEAAAMLQKNFDRVFAQEMTRRFDLSPNKKYKQLSFGMKTMLSTIISLANNSKVVLLDEPTLGLDAIMRDQFNALLLESYNTNPRIIIVSTHLIDEIAKVTERLIIIESGKLLIEASINDIDERAYTLSGPTTAITPLLDRLNCIGKMAVGTVMAAHIYDNRIKPPAGVSISQLSLQDFFINIVGGKNHE